jgi:DNA-binding LytR/AlgR family response regulator
MKVLFKGNDKEYNKIKDKLESGNFEVVTVDGDYELRKIEKEKSSLIGEKLNKYYILIPKDIIYIESFDHNIVAHCINGDFNIDEKLYEIAGVFIQYGFIRIHKSYVVNKTHIKSIIPEFNRKFRLVMSNNHEIEVSRRYFVEFKESIGMKVKS